MKRFTLLLSALCLFACTQDPPPYQRGIDLSHHNGPVDWDALEAEDVHFIYLKATEGTDWKDPAFQDHWQAATQRGYDVAAYHFYLLCKPGAAQAANFIQSVEVRADAPPPIIDLEYSENCAPNGPPETLYAELDAFMATLEAEYGALPMIYTTERFHEDWIAGHFADHPLWIRKIGRTEPVLTTRSEWYVWQYADDGRVAGINGPVDLNYRRYKP